MPTFYLDYENGNDANDGTTFANRWKTITSGSTGARVNPGDTVRIMASPDPTSIGNATWTGGGRKASVSIASSTNATPIEITTSAAHGLSANDYVLVVSHTTNTNANGVWKVGAINSTTKFTILEIDGTNTTGNGVGGASGSITQINNNVVKTSSPLVQNIALCGGLVDKPVWTQSTNVTTARELTNYKEGYSSASIAINATFTTGKAAYYTLPAALNLSAYQQVSFWIRLQSGTVGAAGSVYLALCTDTIGDTVAHQCNIPALGTTGVWVPVTVNLGTNLNSAIQSVAFYVVTDNAAQTFYIDNIVACKATSSNDSISLTSLLSKSDGTGDEAWYAIQSINSDVAIIASQNTTSTLNLATASFGYNGTTETVTTYKRETIKTVPVASGSVQAIQRNGITYSGGWNRTDMSTQTGETWFDGQNSAGSGLSIGIYSDISINKVNFCRYNTGYQATSGSSTGLSIISSRATACDTGFDINAPYRSTITSIWANNCGSGINLSALNSWDITSVKSVENCAFSGIYFNGAVRVRVKNIIGGNCNRTGNTNGAVRFNGSLNIVIDSLTINNGGIGILSAFSSDCFINGGSTTGNIISSVGSSVNSKLFFNNFTMNETVEIANQFGSSLDASNFIYSNRHDNTDNNSWIWQGIGTINQQTAIVDSPATTSWKMNPTSNNATTLFPLMLKLGTVICAANSLVTVTARMRRSSTDLTMRLCCPGNQISGVASDVISDMTAAANTWETVTITFTPTKPGGVDIYAYAFGGTTRSGYVCNLTASQA